MVVTERGRGTARYPDCPGPLFGIVAAEWIFIGADAHPEDFHPAVAGLADRLHHPHHYDW